jgi:hypothetical protein
MMLSLNVVHVVDLVSSLPSYDLLLFDSVNLFILSFDILQWSGSTNRVFIPEDKQTGIRSEVCVQVFKSPGCSFRIA